MADSPLIIKSKEFALQIIKVCNFVKQTKRESVLTNQLIRSGTSVGANIREAFYGHGTADFIAKLQIALKECSESEYWLELLIESGYYDNRYLSESKMSLRRSDYLYRTQWFTGGKSFNGKLEKYGHRNSSF